MMFDHPLDRIQFAINAELAQIAQEYRAERMENYFQELKEEENLQRMIDMWEEERSGSSAWDYA